MKIITLRLRTDEPANVLAHLVSVVQDLNSNDFDLDVTDENTEIAQPPIPVQSLVNRLPITTDHDPPLNFMPPVQMPGTES